MLLLEQSFLTPPNIAFTLQQKGIPEEFTLEWGHRSLGLTLQRQTCKGKIPSTQKGKQYNKKWCQLTLDSLKPEATASSLLHVYRPPSDK